MADNRRYLQAQFFTLAGSGAALGANSITLNSFKQIDGALITMVAAFGLKGFGTLEPGAKTQEEQISFTGVTQNVNGTATLTGVAHVDFIYPYTETPNLAKSHAGGTKFIISNTSGFYNNFANKEDNETINEVWTFLAANRPALSVDINATLPEQLITQGELSRAVIGAVPSASTIVPGIAMEATQADVNAMTASRLYLGNPYQLFVNPSAALFNNTNLGFPEEATQAEVNSASASGTLGRLAINPSAVLFDATNRGLPEMATQTEVDAKTATGGTGANLAITPPTLRSTLYSDYVADTGAVNAYVITPSPAIAGYVTGQEFTVLISVTNTGASTLNVNGQGATAITNKGAALVGGELVAGQIYKFVKAAASFQLMTSASTTFILPTSASYLNYQMMPINNNTANQALGFVIANLAVATFQGGAGYLLMDSAGGVNPLIYNTLPGIGSNPTLRFADIGTRPIFIQFRARMTAVAATEQVGLGFADTATELYAAQTSTASSSIRFVVTENAGNKLYAVNGTGGGGGTTTATDVTGALTLTNWHTFGFEISSTQILFYVDGTLVATHNTNLPTTANVINCGWGIEENGSQPKCDIAPTLISLPLS